MSIVVPEILIVDDNLNFAQEFAEYINEKCEIQAIATDTAESAEEYVKKYPIKIVVLDQVMPVKGTDLFIRLIKINPYLRSILLTGQSTTSDIVTATELKFDCCMMKNKYKKLPETIFQLYVKYDNSLDDTIDHTPFAVTSEKGIKKHKVLYSLININVINEDFISHDNWRTVKRIEAGQKSKEIQEIILEEELSISKDSRALLESSFSINNKMLQILSTKLQSVIEQSVKTNHVIKKIVKLTKEMDICLPDNWTNEAGKRMISRSYEYTQVYKEIKVYIKKHCTYCNSNVITSALVYLPTNKLAYQTKEYFDDNTDNVLSTGHHSL